MNRFKLFKVAGLVTAILLMSTAFLLPSHSNSVIQPGTIFYSYPNTKVKNWVASHQSDGRMPAIRDKIANRPASIWVGSNWTSNGLSVNTNVNAAKNAAKMPVIVLYNIPNRDCGGFSQGGANDSATYRSWINGIVMQIGNNPVTIVLEPDSLSQNVSNPSGCPLDRSNLLYAVSKLKANGNAHVYIDAGNAMWPSNLDALAQGLRDAGIAQADGFALNVSNFYWNSQSFIRGDALSLKLGGKHYIIDTSRNGLGSNGQWCNPPGRRIGISPTTNTNHNGVDAFLWIKLAGESDGACNGGPPAGQFSPDLAYKLATN